MDLICIFLILGSLFYGAKIFLDYNQTALEITEKVDACDRKADRLAELIEDESRQKLETEDRVATLNQRVVQLQERATSLKGDFKSEREVESRIQLALTKNRVREARSRQTPVSA